MSALSVLLLAMIVVIIMLIALQLGRRPKVWQCRTCGAYNQQSYTTCFDCGAPKP